MTQAIGDAAKNAAAADTKIIALNPPTGPKSIQGAEDGAAALPGLFQLFDREITVKTHYDAVIIACFDDTGLWDLRQKTNLPVLGIGEASFHTAMLLGKRFSVVTTLEISIPIIEQNIEKYGFTKRCSKVRSSGIPVLALEGNDQSVKSTLRNEIGKAFAEDNIDCVVLGCAGMAAMAKEFSQEFGKPVIDGVQSAVQLGETLKYF